MSIPKQQTPPQTRLTRPLAFFKRARDRVRWPFIRYRYMTPPQRRVLWRDFWTRQWLILYRGAMIVGLLLLLVLPHSELPIFELPFECANRSKDLYCIAGICIEQASNNNSQYQEIFGFEEYLAAMALFVVLYTIADFRFKFRISVAPVRLRRNTFWLLISIGIAAVVAETAAAESWSTPRTCFLNRHTWQLGLGLAFFLTLLNWMYYAFIRPPRFGHRNAEAYYGEVYHILRRGNEAELAELGNELARSARDIVEMVAEMQPDVESSSIPARYAHDTLLIIADRRFCRHLVKSSPGTAYAFFSALNPGAEILPRAIGPFGRAISGEAILNHESFIYQETALFPVGGLAQIYPVTSVLYGNYRVLDRLSPYSPIDLRFGEPEWRAKEWVAYCRVTLIAFKGYVRNGLALHPGAIFQALSTIESALPEVAKAENYTRWESEGYQRTHAIVELIKGCLKEIHESDALNELVNGQGRDLLDRMAELCVLLVMHAGRVEGSQQLLWSIHHNMIWADLVERLGEEAPVYRAFRARFFRALRNEISKLLDFPNYKGAPLLGFLLHVLGLSGDVPREGYRSEARQITYWVRHWARKHFWALHLADKDVAEDAMLGPLSLDIEGRRILYTHHTTLPRRATVYELPLDTSGDQAAAEVLRPTTPYKPRWRKRRLIARCRCRVALYRR